MVCVYGKVCMCHVCECMLCMECVYGCSCLYGVYIFIFMYIFSCAPPIIHPPLPTLHVHNTPTQHTHTTHTQASTLAASVGEQQKQLDATSQELSTLERDIQQQLANLAPMEGVPRGPAVGPNAMLHHVQEQVDRVLKTLSRLQAIVTISQHSRNVLTSKHMCPTCKRGCEGEELASALNSLVCVDGGGMVMCWWGLCWGWGTCCLMVFRCWVLVYVGIEHILTNTCTENTLPTYNTTTPPHPHTPTPPHTGGRGAGNPHTASIIQNHTGYITSQSGTPTGGHWEGGTVKQVEE